jgi:GIY-YIG catalytic domain
LNVAQLYRHFDKSGTLLYVGISISAVRRLAQHKTKAAWFPAIALIEVEHFPNRAAAQRAEVAAIIKERPKYNLAHSVVPASPPPEPASPLSRVARRLLEKRAVLRFDDAARYLDLTRDELRFALSSGLGPKGGWFPGRNAGTFGLGAPTRSI